MENTAASLRNVLAGGEVNVGKAERLASMFGGGFLVGAGIRRGGGTGALVGLAGAILLHRGATGHCHLYGAAGIDASEPARQRGGGIPARGPVDGTRLQAAITIGRAPEEVYAFWRDFTHAPRFMEQIAAVRVLDERRSVWTAVGPRGRTWEWTSELTEDVPNRRLAWHSLPGSDLPNRGSVEFTPGGRAGQTVVRHTLEFDPPGGVVGQAIASALHPVPEQMIRDDLRRLKGVMESAGNG